MEDKIPQKADDTENRRLNRKDIYLLSIVTVISLFLNTLGFRWGKDGYTAWSPDSIEGQKVVEEIPNLFGQWTNKYPRLQYLIDGLCYQLLIHSWENDQPPVRYDEKTGVPVLTQKQLDKLATLSRVNILIMSSLIILFIYFIACFYYGNSIAAFISSLSVAATITFVYYSHASCVDIPSTFWITLGVYFLLRSIYSGKLVHHVIMAIAFACACCTKDPMLFYAAAFALAYIALRCHFLVQRGFSFKASLFSLTNRNTWTSLAVFLFLFALLQGILFSPTAYWERMSVWVGGRGVKEFTYGFDGQWKLFIGTLRSFYWGIGWPLILLISISLLLTPQKQRLFNLVVVILPLILFYVLVSMRIQMSYIRYYLPVMGLWYLPVGAFVSRLWTLKNKRPAAVSLGLVLGCYVLSLMYCVALDTELINDSRNQAAQWFVTNVKKDTPVLSLVRFPYGPQLLKYDYPMMDSREITPFQDLLQNRDKLPDYIILSNDWLTANISEATELKKALLEGKTEYSIVSKFHSKGYLIPRKCSLSIAAWPMSPRLGEISPEIIIMKKNAEQALR